MIRLNPQKIQKSKKQKKVKANLTNDLKAHFLSALKANPDFSEAHLQLAQLYQEEGDNKNTDHHFKSAIASDSQQALDLENRGEELLKKFQFQNAKDQFMKAQEKKNHCAEVYYQQSIFFKNQNKTEAVQTSLENSIKMNPSISEVHRDYGILLSQENQIDNARLHLEKALDLNYGDFISHYRLGMIMVKMKDYDDAEQHFLSALDIDPGLVDCIVELAALKLDIDQKEEAKKYYKKAKTIVPELKHSKLEKLID
mgnify:CR=1 FL=1